MIAEKVSIMKTTPQTKISIKNILLQVLNGQPFNESHTVNFPFLDGCLCISLSLQGETWQDHEQAAFSMFKFSNESDPCSAELKHQKSI